MLYKYVPLDATQLDRDWTLNADESRHWMSSICGGFKLLPALFRDVSKPAVFLC